MSIEFSTQKHAKSDSKSIKNVHDTENTYFESSFDNDQKVNYFIPSKMEQPSSEGNSQLKFLLSDLLKNKFELSNKSENELSSAINNKKLENLCDSSSKKSYNLDSIETIDNQANIIRIFQDIRADQMKTKFSYDCDESNNYSADT